MKNKMTMLRAKGYLPIRWVVFPFTFKNYNVINPVLSNYYIYFIPPITLIGCVVLIIMQLHFYSLQIGVFVIKNDMINITSFIPFVIKRATTRST